MNQMLSTSWGRNVISALLGALLVVVLGFLLQTPRVATLFASVIFAIMLVIVVQLGEVLSILWSSRGGPSDVGETMAAELETEEGERELKRMGFTSLLTVAIVQELYLTLFKRDRPIWAFEFLGVGGDLFDPKDYGRWNRYLEWLLIIGIGVMSGIAALLIATFVYAIAVPTEGSAAPALLLCVFPSFPLGALLVFPLALFMASVVRRLFILYSARAGGTEPE